MGKKVITLDVNEARQLLSQGYKIYWLSYWDTPKSLTYCLVK